jgi:adenylosuccinate synthase
VKAQAVIGANYGDEGKGLMTDYLVAREGAQVVIRFNGGAQAGHTVVTPDRYPKRHVFSHFGSGTFAGAATYLSEFFVVNPILFCAEHRMLKDKIKIPLSVLVDPNCMVTTPIEMLLNQAVEKARGNDAHGSCGVGFNETIERDMVFPLRVSTLFSDAFDVHMWLEGVMKYYVPARCATLGIEPFTLEDRHVSGFIHAMAKFREHAWVYPLEYLRGKKIVFEGAQGLGLDQDNHDDFPHLTRSNTGIKNVYFLAKELGISELEAVYVTRSYLTRHGNGPLRAPAIEPQEDDTNLPHPWQGAIRFAELDPKALRARIMWDTRYPAIPTRLALAVTHADQLPVPEELYAPHYFLKYIARGPTRKHVVETT